jgi:hypothetical protein
MHLTKIGLVGVYGNTRPMPDRLARMGITNDADAGNKRDARHDDL